MGRSKAEIKTILTNSYSFAWFLSLAVGSIIVVLILGINWTSIFPFFIISGIITIPYVLFIYILIDFNKICTIEELIIFQIVGFVLTMLILSFLFYSVLKILIGFGLIYFVLGIIIQFVSPRFRSLL